MFITLKKQFLHLPDNLVFVICFSPFKHHLFQFALHIFKVSNSFFRYFILCFKSSTCCLCFSLSSSADNCFFNTSFSVTSFFNSCFSLFNNCRSCSVRLSSLSSLK